MEKRTISFSPPDISELEIAEVAEALRSGWITTGPRTKMLECRLAAYIETGRTDIDCSTKEAIKQYSQRVVCLNSATAAEELNLRILGVGPGDDDGDVCIIGLKSRKRPQRLAFLDVQPFEKPRKNFLNRSREAINDAGTAS